MLSPCSRLRFPSEIAFSFGRAGGFLQPSLPPVSAQSGVTLMQVRLPLPAAIASKRRRLPLKGWQD